MASIAVLILIRIRIHIQIQTLIRSQVCIAYLAKLFNLQFVHLPSLFFGPKQNQRETSRKLCIRLLLACYCKVVGAKERPSLSQS